jgi:hypothetical protein
MWSALLAARDWEIGCGIAKVFWCWVALVGEGIKDVAVTVNLLQVG